MDGWPFGRLPRDESTYVKKDWMTRKEEPTDPLTEYIRSRPLARRIAQQIENPGGRKMRLNTEVYIKPQFYNVTAVRTKEQKDFLDFLFNGPMRELFKTVFEHYPKYLELVEYVEYFGIADRPVLNFLQMEEDMGLFFMKLASMEDEKARRFPYFVKLYEELKNMKDFYSVDPDRQHERLQEIDGHLNAEIERYATIKAITNVLAFGDSFIEQAKKRIESTGVVALTDHEKTVYAFDVKFLPFMLMDWAIVKFCERAPGIIEAKRAEEAKEMFRIEQEQEEFEAKAKQEAEERRLAEKAEFTEKLEDLADRIKKDLALGNQGDKQHFVRHWERVHGIQVIDYIFMTDRDGVRHVREVVLDQGDGQHSNYTLKIPKDALQPYPKANYLPNELRNVPTTADARYLQKQYLENSRVFEDDVDYKAWREEQLAERDKPEDMDIKGMVDNAAALELAKKEDRQTFGRRVDVAEQNAPDDGVVYEDNASIDIIEDVDPIVQVGDVLVTKEMQQKLEWLAAAGAYLTSVGRAFQVLKLEFSAASHDFFKHAENKVIERCVENQFPAELVYLYYHDLQRRMEEFRLARSYSDRELQVKACTGLLQFFNLVQPLKENIESKTAGLKMSAVLRSEAYTKACEDMADEIGISIFDLERQLRDMQREEFIKHRELENTRREEEKGLQKELLIQADALLDLASDLFPEVEPSFFEDRKVKANNKQHRVENLTKEEMTSILTFGKAILLIGQDEGSRKMLNRKQIARELLADDFDELYRLVKEAKKEKKSK